jgi:hypothetical protein
VKVSVVISEGVKQVMFTPENDHEREALKWIAPGDSYEVATEWGTFDNKPQHYSYNVSMSQGGNLRRFAEEDSLMFVLTPKDTEDLHTSSLTSQGDSYSSKLEV